MPETVTKAVTDPDGQLVALANDDGWRLRVEVRVTVRAGRQYAMLVGAA